MKKLTTTLAILAMLAGCASPENRAALTMLQQNCSLGHQGACDQIPLQEQINHDEATANAGRAALIMLLLPIAILAAAYSNPYPDTYVVVPVRHRY